MGDWERTFGEAGMQDGFIDSMIRSWRRQDGITKKKITLLFETAVDAQGWAKEHPGSAITRHPNGEGYIARTWAWYYDEGNFTLFGTPENARDAIREIAHRDEIIQNAGQIMGQHTYTGAEWLFYSGYENLLTTLYEETRAMREAGRMRSLEEEHKIREKLVALLPKDIENVNMYMVRASYGQSKGFAYEIKQYLSGWLGEVESRS
ncbi:hypothetical protein [Cupriavidus oxalaticus]|uniref:Uncharacterized protein n=1 Tax=Cupriavidus oxalaticus TaxID=96344 RepID=A0A4P7LSL4_9BURK|nr:hypothetical protein [Cupriavidus oxalaticus]QBY55491.1 hypothetical protein E0W60_31185 [Cupriavidus oxalaticus]